MKSIDLSAVWSKMRVVLIASFFITAVGTSCGFAQQAAVSDATQQKIDQLAKLLQDPDIRALVAQRAKPAPEDDMPGTSANDYTIWINRIRQHLLALTAAVPLIPDEFQKARDTTMAGIDGRRPISVLALFLLLVAIGLSVEWLFGRIARRLHANRVAAHPQAPSNGFQIIGRHLFAEVAPLVVFGLASVGLFLAMTWPELLTRLIVPTLLAVIVGRLIIRLTRILLTAYPDPRGEGSIRLIPVDRAAARFWFRRVVIFMSIFFFGWALNGIMMALGFDPGVRQDIVYLIGIGLLVVAVEVVWRRPRPADHPVRHGVLEWLLTFWLCFIWVAWVAGAHLLMWVCAYLIIVPCALKIVSVSTHAAFARQVEESEEPSNAASSVYEVLVERGARAAVIAIAAVWLAMVMRVNSTMMMQEETASRILRGVLSGVVILLVADLLWQMAKAFINHRLERARVEQGDAAAIAQSGRLLTLLPILRNFLAVIIAVIAVLMVLSGLGIAVGPLIAGAGIFGVAIGFGSQTLVKDVISGVFYMMDDAFRVGEYIQSGSYKGTVESFSIRSVRLRHHRGPVFTVPFGVLGAVQNMSRDWAIDKFMISVSYQTDIAKVKKLVKGVGAELLADPEIGPQLIETVKMKGVEQFGDYGINISFAMTTKPGHQSGIRRRAFAMIREAFVANGIDFASPTVQVAKDEHAELAAAVATTNAIMQKKVLASGADGG